MKTYKEIREALKLNKNQFAKILGVSLRSYMDTEEFGRKIDTKKSLPIIREMAQKAGFSDTELLDMFCSESPPKRPIEEAKKRKKIRKKAVRTPATVKPSEFQPLIDADDEEIDPSSFL